MKILLLVLSFLLLEAYAQNAPCVVISKTGTVPTFTGYTTQITTLNTTLFKTLNNPLMNSTTPLYMNYPAFSAVTHAGQSGVDYMRYAIFSFMEVLSQLVTASTSVTTDLNPLNKLQTMMDNINKTFPFSSTGSIPAFVINGMNASLVSMINALTMLNNIVIQPSLDATTMGINLPVSILMRSAASAANLTAVQNTMAASVTLFVNNVANVSAQFNVIIAANAPLEVTSIAMQNQFLNVSNLLNVFANNSGLIFNNTVTSFATQITNTFNSAFSVFPAKLQNDSDFISNQTNINTTLNGILRSIMFIETTQKDVFSNYAITQIADMQQQYQAVLSLTTPIRQLVYNYYLGQSVIQPSNPKNLTCGEQFASSFSSIFNANGSSLFFNSHYDLVNASMTRLTTYMNTTTNNMLAEIVVSANVLRSCGGAVNSAPDCMQTFSPILNYFSNSAYMQNFGISGALTGFLNFNTRIASLNNIQIIKALNTTYSTPINKFLSCSGMSLPSP